MLRQSTTEKLPREAYPLFLGVTISAVGNGLVIPFFVVYIHQGRGLPVAVAGLVLSWMGIASLLFAPVVGWLIDHFGPKPTLIFGLIVSAVGYTSLGFIRTAPEAFLVATLCATGQGTMWPAQSAFLAEVTTEEQRERVFGVQFALLNLGIAVGSIIASLAVVASEVSSFTRLYLGDGFTYLLYIGVVLTIRNSGSRSKLEKADRKANQNSGSWRDVVNDRAFRRVWIVSFVAIFFGYSQLEVGFTSYATFFVHAKLSLLAWAFAANTITIAVLQMWVLKRVKSIRRSSALAVAAGLWAASWGAVGMSGLTRAVIFLVAAQVVFAAGEMLWSPVLPALVNSLAPVHLRGRYNAASGAAWQMGLVLGPSMAGTLLGARQDRLWLGLTMAGCLAASFLALSLRKVLPQDAKMES
ncbi:MAG TPA: MFS transporter [Candidatus Nanopelagicaceae bacterium]|nr:MFS transporter [Candidatus Nanopelagicaceae bacterium]